ncbi:MAG: hypothetical protein V7K76_17660 [Nostoc sp.]|uniref:hypothetical protein n=1 Tax=Nostoc sp. TaxID=1180 RepID=UPI002FF89132
MNAVVRAWVLERGGGEFLRSLLESLVEQDRLEQEKKLQPNLQPKTPPPHQAKALAA